MAHAPVLWQQAQAYPAAADRNLLAALWPAGGLSGGVVTAVNNTMTVSVAAGSAAVPLQSGQGSALCRWDAAEVPPALGAAPPTGQSRIDLIVVQVRDNAIDSGSNNDFVLAVVPGNAGATPSAPAVPANALALCTVTVPGTVANLNTATITPRAPGNLAVGGGAILGQLVLSTPTQTSTAIGGSWGGWINGTVLPFVAPPSGAVLLSEEFYVQGLASSVLSTGWQDGGITSGTGAGQCPSQLVLTPVGVRIDMRVRASHRVAGLTPGQLYTPQLYEISAGGVSANVIYGGNSASGGGGAGPMILTAQAA